MKAEEGPANAEERREKNETGGMEERLQKGRMSADGPWDGGCTLRLQSGKNRIRSRRGESHWLSVRGGPETDRLLWRKAVLVSGRGL